jgi:hypothetical protein
MHQFPFNIAFACNQSYNVPQNSIGLAFHKSNDLLVNVATFALLLRLFQLSDYKGKGNSKMVA